MTQNTNLYQHLQVPDNKGIDLAMFDPRWQGGDDLKALDEMEKRSFNRQMLEQEQSELAKLQDKLYADNRFAVVLILEGMAGADLDEVIRRVMSGVNPQGCRVNVLKKPSEEERKHDFLWRYIQAMPVKGNIAVFKKSYYSELVNAIVDPSLVKKMRHNPKDRPHDLVRRAIRGINALEQHISQGTLILKFFLHISIQEQRRRFLKWMDDPALRWRLGGEETAQHDQWDAYQAAFRWVLNATSKPWGPWYVLPCDHEWVAPALAVQILTDAIEKLGVDYPVVSAEQKEELEEGRRRLLAE
jgi:polyphosphate kinase 2 (PPK2 family)